MPQGHATATSCRPQVQGQRRQDMYTTQAMSHSQGKGQARATAAHAASSKVTRSGCTQACQQVVISSQASHVSGMPQIQMEERGSGPMPEFQREEMWWPAGQPACHCPPPDPERFDLDPREGREAMGMAGHTVTVSHCHLGKKVAAGRGRSLFQIFPPSLPFLLPR